MFLKTHQLVPKFHIPDHFQVGHKTVHSARMSPPLAWFGPSYPTQPNSSKPAKRSQSQQAGRRTQDLKGKGWRKPKRSVNILHFCVQWKRRHLDGAVDVNGGWGMGLGAGGDVTTGNPSQKRVSQSPEGLFEMGRHSIELRPRQAFHFSLSRLQWQFVINSASYRPELVKCMKNATEKCRHRK